MASAGGAGKQGVVPLLSRPCNMLMRSAAQTGGEAKLSSGSSVSSAFTLVREEASGEGEGDADFKLPPKLLELRLVAFLLVLLSGLAFGSTSRSTEADLSDCNSLLLALRGI